METISAYLAGQPEGELLFARITRLLRRAAALLLALFIALPPLSSARAETDSFAVGDCSDDVLRAEMRLSDMDYLHGVVDGLWSEEDAAAFESFLTDYALLPGKGTSLLLLGGDLPERTVSTASSGVFASGGASGFLEGGPTRVTTYRPLTVSR